MSLLNPNKKYETLFKLIDAKSILREFTKTTLPPTVSIAQFYAFREKLLKVICNHSEETYDKIAKTRSINDYKSQFGMFWIIGVYEGAYGIRIKLSSSI